MRACIEQCLYIATAGGASKGLELAYLVEPDVPAVVEGDEARLRQILVNLLGNAVKFTPAGSVQVSVRAVRGVGRRTCELAFAVQDTGIGIDPARSQELFRPFNQGDSSTTRRFGGTGLGLTISKSLCELMGGGIRVESEPGVGSTFHFTIRADVAPGKATLPEPPVELAGKRVLLVDDTEINLRFLAAQTRSWGMEPVTTTSPVEALRRLRAGERFDLAILDMKMPEMDGASLARAIRAELGTEAPRLVLSSSVGHPREASRGLFDGQVAKPIKAAQLRQALGRAAGRAREGAAVPASGFVDVSDRLPLKILVAEDNPVNRRVAKRTRERFGLAADVARTGVEALSRLRGQAYDVVLMDVQMPEMDGLEATRRLCAERGAEERPVVIAMTANALAEDRDKCLEAGMDDYLSKPLRARDLLAALERWGEQALARRPAVDRAVSRCRDAAPEDTRSAETPG